MVIGRGFSTLLAKEFLTPVRGIPLLLKRLLSESKLWLATVSSAMRLDCFDLVEWRLALLIL